MRRLNRPLEIEIAELKLLVLDVDGVMTNNQMIFLSGDREAKSFNASDGFAIKATTERYLKYAVISARKSEVTTRRCTELGVGDIIMKWNKLEALHQLLEKHQLDPTEVGYIGNDIPDMVVMEAVGLAVCVADCEPELLECSHFQTERNGGRGACREVIRFIMEKRGIDLVQVYRDGLTAKNPR
jgi:3-deoxy-D-manno-octulosonate 8-phosphate phosphatase (KDO 8-P phosphatase)